MPPVDIETISPILWNAGHAGEQRWITWIEIDAGVSNPRRSSARTNADADLDRRL